MRVLYILFILFFVNCGASDKPLLRLAVASNMRYAIDVLVHEFELETGIQCEVIISSSGKLTAQIESGAPFDIFLSADMQYPEYLAKKNLTEGDPLKYAEGRLILWTGPFELSDIQRIQNNEFHPIAIANPITAPYGRAAREVLLKLAEEEFWESRLVFGESISQVNQFLISGATNVGFTAKSVLYSDSSFLHANWIEISESLYSPVNQGLVILNNRKAHLLDAEKFADFLFTGKAKKILEQYGYKTGV